MLFRVYFNRHGRDPWSVDEGTQATERCVEGVVLCGCFWRTQTLTPVERSTIDPEFTPSAWIEVEAQAAELVGGKIVFVP